MNNKHDATVATLVILCSLMLLGALIFAISGDPWRQPHLRFSVDFADVTGIHRNTDVLYAGDKIGMVDRIEHLAPADRIVPGDTVRVHIEVLEPVPVPAKVRVIISAESILGEKHIALVRQDDEDETLLADGARLTSTSLGSLLEMMLPGGDAIFANIRDITADLRKITNPLGRGDAAKKITDSLANIEIFTQELKTTFTGDGKTPGFGQKLNAVADKLETTATGIQELVQGPAGAADKGLAKRADAVFANLETFSKELNTTIAGTEGKPGLRIRIEEITTDLHKLLAGGENAAGPGLEKHLDTTMHKINTLVEEMSALVIWGEYITGTLAEKPSRLIFGSKENEVPSKEQIIEHMRQSKEPYPVRIKELESSARPPLKPAARPMPPDSATPEEKKKGILDLFKRRE